MRRIFIFFSLLLSIIIANAQSTAEFESQADKKVEQYKFAEAFRCFRTCIEQSQEEDTHIRIIEKVTKIIDEKRIYINKEALQAIDSLIGNIRPLYGNDCKYYLPLIEKRIINISKYDGDYKQEIILYNEAIEIRTSNNLLQGAEYEELLSWFIRISVYRKDVSNEDRLKICSDLQNVHKLNNHKIDSLYIELVDSYSGKCHLSKDYQTSIEILELKRNFIEAKGKESSKEYIETLERLALYNSLRHKELYGEESNYMSPQKEKAIHYDYELLKLKTSMGIKIQSYEITILLYEIERFKKDTRETLKIANELKALISQCSNNKNKELIETIDNEIIKYASCTYSADYLFIELLQQKFPNDSVVKNRAKSIIHNPLDHFKDTIKARTVAIDFKNLLEKMYGKENEAYCDALKMETKTYDENNDTTVIPLLRELLSLQEKIFGKEDDYYQYTQMRLTSALSNSHQKQETIDILSENTDEEDISQLFLLASEQSNYGLQRESIKTYEKIIKHCISNSDTLAPIYINSSLQTIAITYNQLNDLDGLIDFGTRWSKEPLLDKKSKESLIRNVIEWAINLDNTGEKVIKFIDNHLSSVTTQVEVLEYIAAIYRKNNQEAKAEETIRQIIAQLKENNSDTSTIAKYEQYLEICLISKGAYNEAIEQHKKVASLVKTLPDYKNSIEYHTLCCCDIIYNYRDNNFDEVIRLYKECSKFNFINYYAQIVRSNGESSIRIFSDFSITIASIEGIYYSALHKKGQTEEAERLLNKDYKDAIASIKYRHTSMIKNVSKSASPIHHILFSFTTLSKKDSLCIKAFDYTLLYKQGFLTTETLMNQQLLNSNNQELLQKFNNLQNIRIAIQQNEAAGLPCDEMKEQEAILHTQLTEDSKIYGDFTKSLNLTWDSIRKTLKPDEIAIEFVNYNSLDDYNEHIAALLLRADWNAPKIVNLFSTKQLPKNIYENNEFSKLCWGPICKYLNGVKNIYFAPAGILYNIGIESLLSPEGDVYMSEKYNLYRLSSTRELAKRTNKNSRNISNAVIYGGIDYKQENLETTPTAEQTEETNSNIELIRDIRGSVSGISYLPGTKTEAESIAKILIANNKCNEAKLLTGKNGTEHSFKSISGEDIKIIHIATHGFYYKNNEKTESNHLTNAPQPESEDKSLTRSGLLFAGAEKTIFTDSQQPSNNDGILTALEISTMDLRALDIVTLSACQTGQGDIANDGVFGLQRGFKKAGANSILMSLWSVDDRATSLLMTEFYKNWIAGKSKHDALEIAKQSVKAHKENGWDNPKYWAAFILLDGLY